MSQLALYVFAENFCQSKCSTERLGLGEWLMDLASQYSDFWPTSQRIHWMLC